MHGLTGPPTAKARLGAPFLTHWGRSIPCHREGASGGEECFLDVLSESLQFTLHTVSERSALCFVFSPGPVAERSRAPRAVLGGLLLTAARLGLEGTLTLTEGSSG